MRRPSSLAVVATLFAVILVVVIATFVVVAIDSNQNPRPGTTVTVPSAPSVGGPSVGAPPSGTSPSGG